MYLLMELTQLDYRVWLWKQKHADGGFKCTGVPVLDIPKVPSKCFEYSLSKACYIKNMHGKAYFSTGFKMFFLLHLLGQHSVCWIFEEPNPTTLSILPRELT